MAGQVFKGELEKMIENSYSKTIADVEPINSVDVLNYGGTEEVIVATRDDLRKIVEEPCLAACLYLYDRNIRTVNSSANRQNIGNNGWIGIDYDSLSESNRKILEQLMSEGIIDAKVLGDGTGRRR